MRSDARDPESATTAVGTGRRPGRPWWIVAAAVALLLFATGILLGRVGAAPATPTSESAAAGFLRDMQVHHAQAVQMSMLVRDRSDDDAVRLLAYDIATGQGAQAGQMYGLLDAWNLPQASAQPRMTWMSYPTIDASGGDHGHAASGASGSAEKAGGPMPGMATAKQIAKLTAAKGEDADRLFLTLMIAHHQGGVEMAESVLHRTDQSQVVAMATQIVASQKAEITTMREMLEKLG